MDNKLKSYISKIQTIVLFILVITVFVLYNRTIADRRFAENAISTAIIAQANQIAVESKLNTARSKELSAESNYFRGQNFLLSLLLGIEAYNEANTLEAKKTLYTNITANPQLRRFLTGHNTAVTVVAYSSDGKYIATASNTIILWDAKTERPIGKPFVGHEGFVLDLAFSPDNKMLASGGTDNKVIFWDIQTGLPIGKPLVGSSNPNFAVPSVYSVAFSPDGKVLASGDIDGTLIFWDVATKKPIEKIQTCDVVKPDDSPYIWCHSWVRSLDFSPDGKILAAGDAVADIVILWDVESRKPIDMSIKDHAVEKVEFSPDGKILAVEGFTGIGLWDVVNKKWLDSKIPGKLPTFSPDGNFLARVVNSVEDKRGDVYLYDIKQKLTILGPMSGHSGYINDIAVSPDGKTIASASDDGTVALWDVERQYPLVQYSALLDNPFAFIDNGISLSPDGKILATGTTDNTIILWDAGALKPVGTPLEIHDNSQEYITDLEISPDGKILAASSSDKFVYLWDTSTHHIIKKISSGFKYMVEVLAFTPDGTILALGGPDGNIVLWNMATLQPTGKTLIGHTGGITDLAFNPAGTLLASGSNDKSVIVWDMTNYLPTFNFPGHAYYVKDVAFSPDGKLLTTVSGDNAILVRNMPDGSYLAGPLYTKGMIDINDVAFSPDGKTLASGGNALTLWDTASWKIIGEAPYWHSISNLTFAKNGKNVIATDSYQINGILSWDVGPKSWIEQICKRVGRNFTRAEWKEYLPDKEYQATCPQWILEP